MKDPILEKMWEDYRKHCYPQACSEIQERETRQAFFSGALAVTDLFLSLAEDGTLSDDQLAEVIADVHMESVDECQKRIEALKETLKKTSNG